jgi:RNA polymerase sigma-70 factor (ECF subfamily)
VTRWDPGLIADGERLLQRATEARERANGSIGRFQLEAALQAAHAARRYSGGVDWRGVLQLAEALTKVAPTLGARVAVAAARAHVDGPECGIAQLDRDQGPLYDRFQPAWATRAQLLAQSGRSAEAAVAYERAISLTTEPAIRRFLQDRLGRLAHEKPRLRRSGRADSGA